MKILCVHQGTELYGSDRSFIQSIAALRNAYPLASIDVVVPASGALIEHLNQYVDNVIFMDVGNVSRKDLKMRPFKNIVRIIKSILPARKLISKYDLLYLNTLVNLSFMLASISCKVKKIIHIREVPASKAEMKIFSTVINIAKMNVIYNSYYTGRVFSEYIKNNSVVVQNGVNRLKGQSENILRDELRILFIGRLNNWKGQDLAVKAIYELKKKYNVVMNIVGDCPKGQSFYKEELHKLINDLGLQDCISVHGFIEEPDLYFNWANVVIVPSKKPEPFGRVAIEANSIGRPVIASDCGGLTEIIGNEQGGYLFKPNEVSDCVEKIQKLISDEYIFKCACEKASRNFEEKFSNDIYQVNFLKAISNFWG